MGTKRSGLLLIAVVAIIGSLAGYPEETAYLAFLMLLMSVYGLTLGGAGQGSPGIKRGDVIAQSLIGGAAFAAVVAPAMSAQSRFGAALAGSTMAGAAWALPVSRPFIRVALGPTALGVTGVELFTGAGCSEALPHSVQRLLVGTIAIALVVLGLVAVILRKGLFLNGPPHLGFLQPARWTLLSFGIMELALFALSPAGIDLSRAWSVAPAVGVGVLGATIVVLSAIEPDLGERAIGLGLLLATVWLTLVQSGLNSAPEPCASPIRSLALMAAFATTTGLVGGTKRQKA